MNYKHISPRIKKIYSETLGEYIYLVPDALPPEKLSKLNGVVYTFSELQLLRGVSKDELKTVHLAKKLFNGELVDPGGVRGLLCSNESDDKLDRKRYRIVCTLNKLERSPS